MMNKYTHDTERWLRSQASLYRASHNREMAGTFTACADDVKALKEEVAALKVAAEALISDVDEYFRCADIGESRDKLAALVGEVER